MDYDPTRTRYGSINQSEVENCTISWVEFIVGLSDVSLFSAGVLV